MDQATRAKIAQVMGLITHTRGKLRPANDDSDTWVFIDDYGSVVLTNDEVKRLYDACAKMGRALAAQRRAESEYWIVVDRVINSKILALMDDLDMQMADPEWTPDDAGASDE